VELSTQPLVGETRRFDPESSTSGVLWEEVFTLFLLTDGAVGTLGPLKCF